MGFDIYGFPETTNRPKLDLSTATEEQKMKWHDEMSIWEQNTPGAYFRANYGAWHELLDKLMELNETLLNRKLDMSEWMYNDGAGATEEDCILLADTISIHMKDEMNTSKTLSEFVKFLYNCNGFYIL